MKKDKQMNVRLDKDMDRWINRKAKAWKMDRSKVVTKALVHYRAMDDFNLAAKQAKEQGE